MVCCYWGGLLGVELCGVMMLVASLFCKNIFGEFKEDRVTGGIDGEGGVGCRVD